MLDSNFASDRAKIAYVAGLPGGPSRRAGQASRGPIAAPALSSGVGGGLWQYPTPAHLRGGGLGFERLVWEEVSAAAPILAEQAIGT